MDPLTLTAAVTTVAGLGAGWRWRCLAHRAELTAAVLRGELRAERHAASHDPLTGLPNRRAFYRLGAELIAAPRRRELVAAVLDLDDFKQINDRFGHAAGDDALISIARRFAVYAGGDLVARLGGDEFAGLLTSTTTDEGRLRRVERQLTSMLTAPVTVADRTVTVTASVGLAIVPERTGLDEVLRRADAAMYRAKTRRIYRSHVAASVDTADPDTATYGNPALDRSMLDARVLDSAPFDLPEFEDDLLDSPRCAGFGCHHDMGPTGLGPASAQPPGFPLGPTDFDDGRRDWPAGAVPVRTSTRHLR